MNGLKLLTIEYDGIYGIIGHYTSDSKVMNYLLKLKDYISSLKTVDKVEILPYHDMGKYKWKKLGVNYELENVRNANQEDINKAKKILGIS